MRTLLRALSFMILSLSIPAPASEVSPELKARIEALEELAKDAPREASVLLLLGDAYAAAGDSEKAIALLNRIAETKSGLVPPQDHDFHKLQGDPGFDRALAGARAASPIVKKATVAFRVREPDLVPEGVAFDPRTRDLFMGGMYTRKIVAIDKKGRVRDFARRDDVGGPVLGMKVHERELWAVTNWPDPTRSPRSSVVRFDLRTGNLLARYVPGRTDAELNDLTVSGAGDVYVSDSGASGALYRIARGSKTIEPFLPEGSIRFGNGIAVTPDGKTLFLGNWRGIWRIDVATKKFARLEHETNISASAIDGLYLHEGTLIGIQNWTHPGRVVRWTMSSDQTRLLTQEVLESGNPAFEEPTTGTISRDAFYFIANSQLRRMSDDGTSLKRAVDPETVILKVPL